MTFYYFVNFKLIPSYFEAQRGRFLRNAQAGEGRFFQQIYQATYERGVIQGDAKQERHFTPEDFEVHDLDMGEDRRVLVITLPAPADFESEECMLCLAYAVPYREVDGKLQIGEIYTVEQSKPSANDPLKDVFALFGEEDMIFLGTMSPKGHRNLGHVTRDPQNIAEAVCRVAF